MQSNCSTTWESVLDYNDFPPNRPPKKPIGPNNPRTRSFAGCVTCRSRHVKCDEGRPTCAACRWLGIKCGGYGKNIFFDFDAEGVENGGIRTRRLLMTEEERRSMSESMTSMIRPRSALWHISRIEEECENSSKHDPIQILRGPFGAFRVNSQTSPVETLSSQNDIEDITVDDPLGFGEITDGNLEAPETALSPWTQKVFQSIFDFSEPYSDPVDVNSFDMMWGSNRIEEIFDDIPLSPEMQSFPIDPIQPPLLFSPALSPTTYEYPRYVSVSQLSTWPSRLSPAPIPSTTHVVPPHTVLLLNHFSTTVINSLTPFRHTKTPWHVIFVPLANQCLAALTLGNELDHASLTAFNGMLAISAFSLGGQSRSQMWLEQGRLFKQQAREHARMMLKTAYNIPKASKYKTILLAMITMVQVSIFSGNRDQTECYLLETEKFIRLRGLNKKKSRRVRLLHHCYAYERMFHETFVVGPNSTQRHHVRNVIESSGLRNYSYDNLTFRLPTTWRSLDEEMFEMKSQEAGENDLHVERSGVFPTTLYPEIFGVPELYLHLLSLTIRLGYEKDASEQSNSTETLSLVDFTRRAKDIEKHIHRLSFLTTTTDQLMSKNIFSALQGALAIYFYRRIYNLDASMLQTHVSLVLENLLVSDRSDPNQTLSYGSARTIWPAFIAACEAESPSVQGAFREWFENSARRSGLGIFDETLKKVEMIWKEKGSGSTLDGGCVTWLDVMRRANL